MSYGAAGRRDERRKVAIKSLEASVKLREKWYEEARKANTGSSRNAETQQKANHYADALLRARTALANTQANMGKGTSAMQKKEDAK